MLPYNILKVLDRYGYLDKAIYQAITKNAGTARDYAMQILGGRFKEGEPAILQSAHNTYFYIQDLARYNRLVVPKDDHFADWPEAGQIIMKSPEYAFLWARDEIKGRWLEAEPYIAKDGVAAVRYAFQIIKGRFPEAEKNIKKLKHSPEGSINRLLYHDYINLLHKKGYDPEELGFG